MGKGLPMTPLERLKTMSAEIQMAGSVLDLQALKTSGLDNDLMGDDGPCIYVPLSHPHAMAVWQDPAGIWWVYPIHEWTERDAGHFAEAECDKPAFSSKRSDAVVTWLAKAAAVSVVDEWREAQADEEPSMAWASQETEDQDVLREAADACAEQPQAVLLCRCGMPRFKRPDGSFHVTCGHFLCA